MASTFLGSLFGILILNPYHKALRLEILIWNPYLVSTFLGSLFGILIVNPYHKALRLQILIWNPYFG